MVFKKGHEFRFKKGNIPYNKGLKRPGVGGRKKGCVPWNKDKKGVMPLSYWKGKKIPCSGWNKGKTGVYSRETIKKMRLARLGKSPWNKGKKGIYSPATLLKMRNYRLGKSRMVTESERRKRSLAMRGKKSRFWKGGISKINNLIRQSYKYHQWRFTIYQRDNFTCKICKKYSGKLHVDHYPKMFAQILKENNIKTKKQSESCKELWNISNGRTLCVDCHKKTLTYLKRL